jgi:hypothetical protein
MWLVVNRDAVPPRPCTWLRSGATRIENDGAAWIGTVDGYDDYEDRNHPFVCRSTGAGGYAGLSALLPSSGRQGERHVEGLVFPGSMPEYPDPITQAPE